MMVIGSLVKPLQAPVLTPHAGLPNAQRRFIAVRASALELPDNISKVKSF